MARARNLANAPPLWGPDAVLGLELDDYLPEPSWTTAALSWDDLHADPAKAKRAMAAALEPAKTPPVHVRLEETPEERRLKRLKGIADSLDKDRNLSAKAVRPMLDELNAAIRQDPSPWSRVRMPTWIMACDMVGNPWGSYATLGEFQALLDGRLISWWFSDGAMVISRQALIDATDELRARRRFEATRAQT